MELPVKVRYEEYMYAEHGTPVRSMSDLFGNYVSLEEKFETHGDFLKYFSLKTGLPIGRVGYKLKGLLDLKTLFYIKSVCDKHMLEGTKSSYQHAFNSALYLPQES